MSACTIHVPASEAGALHRAAAQLAAITQALTTDSIITVCIEPGVHTLNGRPLQLGPLHNHPHGARVTWRGHPTLPTVVSAGVQLTKWSRCFDGIHCNWPEWNDVWVHDVPPAAHSDSEGAAAVVAPFRQLWVGGVRAARATSDGRLLQLTPTPYGFASASGHAVLNGSDAWVDDQVELRWPGQIRNWIEPRCVLSRVSGRNLSVAPACWKALIARNGGQLPPPPLLVENIVQPPPPGEFVSSANYVFYRPRPEEPYAAPTDAWVPMHEAIVDARGLVNHTFVNLTFSHATWRQPSAATGYVPTQSVVTADAEPMGSVRFHAAKSLSIERCQFRNLGGAYALSIGDASRDVAVRRCVFESLAGGALKLGNVLTAGRELTSDMHRMDRGFDVSDNVLRGVALELRGAAAIFAGYVASAVIAHNTIRDTGYTAISLGWGWGTHVDGPQTYMRGNHVRGNRMTGIMSALNDGGCSYTLGPQPNSSVTDNYCESDRAPVVGSYYHDNGSRYFTTTRNVASTSPAPCVYLQGCCHAPALDIHVSELWCRDEGAVRNRCAKGVANCTRDYPGQSEDCHCEVDSSTVFTVPSGAAWPAGAQAIVDAAGARGGS